MVGTGSNGATRVPSVDRAARVLEFVASSGGVGGLPLASIARELDMPRSTAYGVCQTLTGERLLTRGANGAYRLGAAVIELAAARRQHGVSVQRIGVSLPDLSNPFYVAELEAVVQGAQAAGADLLCRSADQSVEVQAAQIRGLVESGVELLIVDPIATQGLEKDLSFVRARGATVVSMNGATLGTDATVVTDNIQAGAAVGHYLCTRLKQDSTVATVGGAALTAVTDRIEGFKAALSDRQDVSIVAEYGGDNSRGGGARAAQLLVMQHPEVDAVFAINDPTALGVDDELRAAGLDSLVVSVDGSSAAVDRIASGGPFSATAAQDPRRLGATAVQVGLGIANGSAAPGRLLTFSTRLITKMQSADYERWDR